MASSSSSIAPSSGTITFTGTSTYSADFQAVLNRAVDIASLPMAAAQTEVSTLQSQQSALTSLDTSFTTLQTDIQNINSAVSGTPSAQVSDTSALTATTSAGALNGTYTIQIDDTGSSTTTLSSAGLATVTDPTTGNISSATSFTLTVNDSSYTITPSGTSLESLAGAINAAGDGVQATIVNVGSTSSPDYRLSLTSTELGADTIQLTAGSQPLLDTLSTGSDAKYTLNNNSPDATQIQSTSSQVTLAPGLTVNLLQKTTSPVTVTVSTDYSGLQRALSTFATDYNSAVTALSAQHGQNGGALQGQSLVYQLNNALNSILQYNSSSGSGSVGSLTDLGLSINDTGVLSFDAGTFSAANPADVQQFLGNTTSSGFLQAANNALTSVTDPTTGILQTADDSIQTDITNENNYISQEQVRIGNLQTTLTQQLSAADAAIATLQSQDTYYQELFTAEYGNGTSSTSGG
jgi:flagellar hook-associated protein 2